MNMPIHLRKFFIKRIEQTMKKRQEEEKKAMRKSKSNSRVTSPKFRR
tara:strand:- start:656 stop:796 length:141 start_codon:yes stop_codon:yes gene_type:complete